ASARSIRRLRVWCAQKTSNRTVGGPIRATNAMLHYFWYKMVLVQGRRRRRKYGLAVAALVAAGLAAVCAAAAPAPLTPVAQVGIGAQAGMVVAAAGSLWSTGLTFCCVV